MISKTKNRRHTIEPAISIPLSKLIDFHPEIRKIRKIIGQKKKLSAKDNAKIMRVILKQIKSNGSAISNIRSIDDLLDWFEKEGMQLYAQGLIKGDYNLCRTANPLLEFYRGKMRRKFDEGKYRGYNLMNLPDEYRQRIQKFNLSDPNLEEKITKIIDEFERSKK